MKRQHEEIYSISFNRRDAEIKRLESERAAISKELEALMREYVKLTGDKRLLPKKRRVNTLLADGVDADKA